MWTMPGGFRVTCCCGKDFEQLYLPGYTHNLGDEYVTRRVFGFFYENIIEK